MRERWLPVPDYEGLYEVSNHGNVRSLDRVTIGKCGRTFHYKGRVLKQYLAKIRNRPSRMVVNLSKDGKCKVYGVARLVLQVFVGPRPEGLECCHRDDDPNNNHLSNLRWDTPSENTYDRIRNGGHSQARKTHCPANHPLEGDNLYLQKTPTGVGRQCKTCKREQSRRQYHRNKGK